MQIEMNDELFLQLTEYCNRSDNSVDNRRRAQALGFTEKKVLIAPGAIIRIPNLQNVGDNVFFGLYTYVNGNVTVGNNVLIGPHCSIAAGNHKFDPATGWFSARTDPDCDSIVIGDGCWLASKVTVTGGVKLGRANLICAGAVVTKSTPDYAIMAGIPARQVGEIDSETGEYIWYHGKEKQ
ncbi:MAG: acyltransferase [Clostridia bacterium]|nr:acyltransferase [Clostridia bacterium]